MYQGSLYLEGGMDVSATELGIEDTLKTANSITFGALEKAIAEPSDDFFDDDPVGPWHTPWGEWLSYWDAIDAMEQRIESQDVIRHGFAPDEILYYAHYIPGKGHKDDLLETYEMEFSYEDYDPETYIAHVREEEAEYAPTTIMYDSTILEEVDDEDLEASEATLEPDSDEETEEDAESKETGKDLEDGKGDSTNSGENDMKLIILKEVEETLLREALSRPR